MDIRYLFFEVVCVGRLPSSHSIFLKPVSNDNFKTNFNRYLDDVCLLSHLEVWLQIWLRIRGCVFFNLLIYFTPCLHCMWSVCMFSLRTTSARLLNARPLFSGVWFRVPSPKRKQTHFFGGMAVWLQIWLRIRRCVFLIF